MLDVILYLCLIYTVGIYKIVALASPRLCLAVCPYSLEEEDMQSIHIVYTLMSGRLGFNDIKLIPTSHQDWFLRLF